MQCDITVVVPAYNASAYIEATLRSVLYQTLKPAEIIVVDDCSTDDTVARVKACDSGIRIIRLAENTGGCSRPRNVGIAAAKTKYVAPFDSDDLMLPEKLERQWKLASSHPELPVIFTDFQPFGPNILPSVSSHCTRHHYFRRHLKQSGEHEFRLSQADVFDSMMYENFIGSGAIIFSKDAWNAVGGYNEQMPSAEDLDFSLRLSEKFPFGYVDRVLHKYHIRADSKSSNKRRNFNCALSTLMRYEVFKMQKATRRAWAHQVLEFEDDLACLCSDAGLLSEALTHWWRAFKLGGLRRTLLRPSRKLIEKSASTLLSPRKSA
jgi:glycosyltransferase involved in cell wall biosynthesis